MKWVGFSCSMSNPNNEENAIQKSLIVLPKNNKKNKKHFETFAAQKVRWHFFLSKLTIYKNKSTL